MNFISIEKFVKRAFCFGLRVEFQTQGCKGNHYLLGVALASKKMRLRRHRNLRICRHYCTNENIINTF
jgi:hypothetical protein